VVDGQKSATNLSCLMSGVDKSVVDSQHSGVVIASEPALDLNDVTDAENYIRQRFLRSHLMFASASSTMESKSEHILRARPASAML